MYGIKRAKSLPHVLVHFVTVHANFLTDHSKLLTMLTPFSILQLVYGHQDMVWRTFIVARLCYSPSVHGFLRKSLHVTRPSARVRVVLLPAKQLFSCSGGDWRFEHLSVFINNTFVRFAVTSSASLVRGQETKSFLQDHRLTH